MLGYLDIQGNSYRGVSMTPSGAFHPMGSAGGALSFSSGLGSLSAAGVRVGAGHLLGGSGGRPAVGIEYVSPRGNNERLDCERQ